MTDQPTWDDPVIIATRRVLVLDSATYEGTRVPVFRPSTRINLSLAQGEDAPYLRIHRSPDPFVVVERDANRVRLQHDWIWVDIAAHDFEALMAHMSAV